MRWAILCSYVVSRNYIVFRFTLLVAILSFAGGCSVLPGTVRSRSIVAPTLKKFAVDSREIPVDASAESIGDVAPNPEIHPQAGADWSPDNLLVGSAIKANVEGQRVAMAQRWEPAFESRQIAPALVETENSATAVLATRPENTGFNLQPPRGSGSDKASEDSVRPPVAKRTQGDPPALPAECWMLSGRARPLMPYQPGTTRNPITQSAYVTSVAEPISHEVHATPSANGSSDYVAAAESNQNPLDQLLSQLQSATRLHLARVCLCRQVDGFGQVVEFPDAQFAAGEDILIYCEIDNFTSQKETNQSGPFHRTSLSGSYLVIDGDGEVVAEHEYPVVDDISQAERDDFFLVFPTQIPSLGPQVSRNGRLRRTGARIGCPRRADSIPNRADGTGTTIISRDDLAWES
jgi:hypothetical protein